MCLIVTVWLAIIYPPLQAPDAHLQGQKAA